MYQETIEILLQLQRLSWVTSQSQSSLWYISNQYRSINYSSIKNGISYEIWGELPRARHI